MTQTDRRGIMAKQKYLRVQDLVDETGLNEETIRSYIRRGLLPATRFGRDYLIEPADWEEFKRRHRTDRTDRDEEEK